MKILLLEDDRILADTIQELLVEDGHECIVAYTGENALKFSYEITFDFYLLDINVPGILGTTLLEELRKSGDLTPAIFITSKDDETSVLNGFDIGCDDYLRKPFAFTELKARINATMRRIKGFNEVITQIDDNISFNSQTYALTMGKETTYLQKKSGQILTYFLNNQNRVIAKDELINDIWDDRIPSDSVIRVHISTIKKLIGKKYITTINGIGYKFEKL